MDVEESGSRSTMQATEPVPGGRCLNAELLEFLFPPLHLAAAAVWHTVQKRQTHHYSKAVEFVEAINDSAPDLVSFRHYAKLSMGLKAKVLLDMFVTDAPHEKIFQTLDLYFPDSAPRHPLATKRDVAKIGEAQKAFRELVEQLIKDKHYREQYLKEEMDEEYGETFLAALQKLLWEYIVRLDSTLPKLPVSELLETASSIEPSSPESSKLMSHLLVQPLAQSLPKLFQYFRELGHLKTPDVAENVRNDQGEDFHIFPASRRQGNSSDADSEQSDDGGLEHACLSSNIPKDGTDESTGKLSDLQKELQVRSLMSQQIDKALGSDSESGFQFDLEKTPKKRRAVQVSSSGSLLEVAGCSVGSELAERSAENSFTCTPQSCSKLSNLQSCSPALSITKGWDHSEFRTPVPTGKQIFSKEIVARVLLKRSDGKTISPENPPSCRKTLEEGNALKLVRKELIETCLKYQPMVLLHRLHTVNLKSLNVELSKNRTTDLSCKKVPRSVCTSVSTSESSSDSEPTRKDCMSQNTQSVNSDLQTSSPEFKIQGRRLGSFPCRGMRFPQMQKQQCKPQQLLKRFMQLQEELKENINDNMSNFLTRELSEIVSLQTSPSKQGSDPLGPTECLFQTSIIPESSDIILDSEDEEEQLHSLNKWVTLKHYQRTKFNTFIPTLTEHMKPEGVRPCYIPLYKGHIPTLMKLLKPREWKLYCLKSRCLKRRCCVLLHRIQVKS
ncbi:TERF1-interacting nuclear factor 2 isoform X2 [Protopterus annectens]|uniref:TERF1-interacting nuclear factor 2 isoform X2 n=1 Tax=Protopterus annectens TaxID=7888 RepID=UPI001CFAB076|nr:TERF1-interacting nuclear factor 2 isoform X2 [Protopterus annectens]